MGQYYVLISNTKAVEQLMDLAARYCQDAVLVISRQFQRQKTRSERASPVFLVYRKYKDSRDTEWHFHTRCSRWPETDYIQAHSLDLRENERLCPECVELGR